MQFERGQAVRNAVGLFLAREVVRLHGGQVQVEATDGGFQVAIELPGDTLGDECATRCWWWTTTRISAIS